MQVCKTSFLEISNNFIICSLKECSNLTTTLQKTATIVSQLNDKKSKA